MGKFENADEWIEAELNETLDEMFEAEFNEPILSQETREYIKKKSTAVKNLKPLKTEFILRTYLNFKVN